MASRRKCKVLLVDDSQSDRLLFRMMLDQEKIPGVDVVGEARDGREAIEYLEATTKSAHSGKQPRADLIVLDLKMPRSDGFDVLEWLETCEVRPWVIVLSDSAADADIKRALALGADKYLQKPRGWPELIESIREFCCKES